MSSDTFPIVRRPAVTLRAALITLLLGALFYVAVAGGLQLVYIGPAASRLQRESLGLMAEYRDAEQRVTALDSAERRVARLFDKSRTGTLSLAALEAERLTLQSLEENARILERLTSPSASTVELRALLGNGVQNEAAFRLALLACVAALELRETDAAERMLARAQAIQQPVRALRRQATEIALRDLNRQEATLAETAQWSSRLVTIWLVLGALSLPFLFVFLRRRLYQPLAELDRGLARIAAGDYHLSLSALADDEFGRVADHFNRMTRMLQRRASEEEERTQLESAARTRAILESALDAVVVIDDKGAIQEWNRQAEIAFGWSRTEVLGRMLETVIIPEELRSSHRRGLAGAQERSSAVMVGRRFETKALRRDGSRFQVELAISELQGHDRREYSAFIRDITEQRRLEAELRRSQKMDAVGRLAGGIAHDFNNLLTTIIGFADLLKANPELGAQARDDAESIQSAAQRGADLARRMLAVGRSSPDHHERVNIDAIVREMVALFTRSVDRRIEISLDLRAGEATIRGDASLLSNALLNLALNARDAMPAGGRMTVTTSVTTLDATFCARQPGQATPGEYVALVIADSGAGMSEETRARIFEPFFTTKPAGEGTGLGLAMVYGTVHSHRGLITVDTALDVGTTFSIYLPVNQSVDNAEVQSAPRLQTGRGRILLVDDEPQIRRVAMRILKSLGYQVDTANDGLDAVERVEATPDAWDLIVMDGNMPRMSGHDAALRIRELRPTLPIVLATGYFDASAKALAAKEVFSAVLAKPYDTASLSKAVAATLAHRDDI